MRACTLVPIYEHGPAFESLAPELAATGLPCLVVDDGSTGPTRAILARLDETHDFLRVIRCETNRGKGAALKTGYHAAREAGFSHVVQLDADGQHDPADAVRFVEAMKASPDALVLGVPRFDASAPRIRIAARQLSRGLVWAACLSREVPDPLCGYRGVPLGPALRIVDAVSTGDHMEFEPEIAVRMVWDGVPVVSLPVRVVYPRGGLSHFSLGSDYPRLAWLYARLLGGMLRRLPGRLRGRVDAESRA